MFGFSKEEEYFLRKLNTPVKVQEYLDSIPFNHEKEGETCRSPRYVLQATKAHCLEGAFVAGAAFLLQGRPPLILNLKVNDKEDDDHVVLLFKENGYWGAVSKTNHAVLNFRDPVYKTVRELAMSYFNEYFFVKDGRKTMKGFSQPINLRRFGTRWMTTDKNLWDIAEFIYDSPYTSTIPKGNEKFIRDATELERKAARIHAS